MTNRKIKDYHKNRELYEILLENFKLICVVLLTLNKKYPKQFYQLNVQRWLEDHVQWCELMEEYEKDSAYEYKMEQFCKECSIDEDTAVKIVLKHCQPHNDANTRVLVENVKLALVHTAVDHGFGKLRMKRLIDGILEENYPEWKEQIKEFGFDVEAEAASLDYRKLKPKKQKAPTLQEQKEAKKMLAEYSAYFDHVLSQG